MADIKAFGEGLIGNLECYRIIMSGAHPDRRCARCGEDHAGAQPGKIIGLFI